MNGSFFKNPTFDDEVKSNVDIVTNNPSFSFIDILKINKGKLINIYLSVPTSLEFKDKSFTGIIEGSGNDFLILSEPSSGKWYFFKLEYLNFIEFEEKVSF